MTSKKRITRVRYTGSSRTSNPPPTPLNSSCASNQPLNSPSATRTANPTPITTPPSLFLSSNVITPLTLSPQIPTFDKIVNKIFSKSLIASLTSKHAVLKEVRDCILTNNKSRIIARNPYIHSYWRPPRSFRLRVYRRESCHT